MTTVHSATPAPASLAAAAAMEAALRGLKTQGRSDIAPGEQLEVLRPPVIVAILRHEETARIVRPEIAQHQVDAVGLLDRSHRAMHDPEAADIAVVGQAIGGISIVALARYEDIALIGTDRRDSHTLGVCHDVAPVRSGDLDRRCGAGSMGVETPQADILLGDIEPAGAVIGSTALRLGA